MNRCAFKTALSAMLALGCATQGLQASAADDVTVVAPEYWCPFSCHSGSPTEGFTIEILRAIYTPLGRKVRYQNLNYARALFAVRSGRYHGTASSFKEEAPDFIFPAMPISRNRYCFYTAPDSVWQFKNASSVAGQRIGIIQGYSYGKELDLAIAQRMAAFEINSGEDLTYRLARKIGLRRLDSFVEDENLVSYTLARHPDLRLRQAGCAPVSYSYFALSPALPLSHTLAREFDEGIVRLHDSGKLEQILKRYGLRDWFAQYRKAP